MDKTRADQEGDRHWLSSADSHRRSHHRTRFNEEEWERHETLRDFFGSRALPGLVARYASPAMPLGGLMAGALKELQSHQAPSELGQAQALWPEVAGVDVAKVSRPLELHRGCLFVAVSGSSWLFLLERHHKNTLLTELRRRVPGIDSLKFVPEGRR